MAKPSYICKRSGLRPLSESNLFGDALDLLFDVRLLGVPLADTTLVRYDNDFVALVMVFLELLWNAFVPEIPVISIGSELLAALRANESVVLIDTIIIRNVGERGCLLPYRGP